MNDTQGPKSAYELAMERLRKQDVAEGIERRVLTPDQKAAVAEVRSIYEAKLAQLEIGHQGEMLSVFEPGQRAALDEAYHRERERLNAERDREVERARSAVP